MSKSLFPKDFLWGASTSSYQVEGGNRNQWSEWEMANADKLASTAKKTMDWLPNWDEIEQDATKPSNYMARKGVDHYHKYEEDFEIVKKLHLNAFRFGIEWSRLEPKEGEWDEKEVEHYRTYIRSLKAKGITPVLNIWHWTHPIWFEKKGAWLKKENNKYFLRFVQKIADEYVNELEYVLTVNEPNVYTSMSFLIGRWPPQNKNTLSALRVYKNLARAHKASYKILKHRKPTLQVGMAAQLANLQAKRPHSTIDELTTQCMRYFWNWWFINETKNCHDFIGFNYYFTDYYKGLWRNNPNVPKSDLGWYMEPEGLYPLLLRVWAHYKKPIIITENGLADGKDIHRQWWIAETMVAMERALSEGVKIKGYFHWSLLDNFEWSDGWWPKFGLVEVDRANGMERKIRPSARWWAKWLANTQSN